MTLDDENEDILVQIQEEQKTISTTFRPEASSGREKGIEPSWDETLKEYNTELVTKL